MQIIKALLQQLLKYSLKKMPQIRAAVALLLLAGNMAATAQTPSREYQLKAVFLFNFTQFIDWPADAFADGQAPFIIGVLGQKPFWYLPGRNSIRRKK